ncbi:serine/threonine protein kinase, partial [Trifolium medium]|nr:serine/threonine protein kinase [Trifolium medium]
MDGNPNSYELLRQVQAALKRRRNPGGALQSNIIRPKRSAVAEAK